MAIRPTTVPTWATDNVNNVAPSLAKRALGWVTGEAPPSGYFNWWQKAVGDWTAFLADALVNFGAATVQATGLVSDTGNITTLNTDAATTLDLLVTDTATMATADVQDLNITGGAAGSVVFSPFSVLDARNAIVRQPVRSYFQITGVGWVTGPTTHYQSLPIEQGKYLFSVRVVYLRQDTPTLTFVLKTMQGGVETTVETISGSGTIGSVSVASFTIPLNTHISGSPPIGLSLLATLPSLNDRLYGIEYSIYEGP